MKKTCLTCKYEPTWSQWAGAGDNTRRYGRCNWKGRFRPIPASYRVTQVYITHYRTDDSGVCVNCQTYEAKYAEEIKRSEFTEAPFWLARCPVCSDMLETSSDPQYEGTIHCDCCGSTLELVGDS